MPNAVDPTVVMPISPTLVGDMVMPPDALGIVVIVHGSGGSRLSSRNQGVATRLEKAGFATLLFDLLTPDEELIDAGTGRFRFNVEMLGGRLARVTRWLFMQRDTSSLPVGYFGVGSGAAAALIAAGQLPGLVGAVVSCGGRPDLAGGPLKRVRAPTLLIVGGGDTGVLDLNRDAFSALGAKVKELQVVTGSTHVFGPPGGIETASALAVGWFRKHLSRKLRPQSQRTGT